MTCQMAMRRSSRWEARWTSFSRWISRACSQEDTATTAVERAMVRDEAAYRPRPRPRRRTKYTPAASIRTYRLISRVMEVLALCVVLEAYILLSRFASSSGERRRKVGRPWGQDQGLRHLCRSARTFSISGILRGSPAFTEPRQA